MKRMPSADQASDSDILFFKDVVFAPVFGERLDRSGGTGRIVDRDSLWGWNKHIPGHVYVEEIENERESNHENDEIEKQHCWMRNFVPGFLDAVQDLLGESFTSVFYFCSYRLAQVALTARFPSDRSLDISRRS